MRTVLHRSLCSMMIALAGISFAAEATVGREGTVTFKWSGEALRTVDQTLESPFHCEIIAIMGEGEDKVYELNYILLEPGKHNLNSALLSIYGRPVDGLPDIWVSAPTLLPETFKGELTPYALGPVEDLDGFSARMFMAAAAWVLIGIGGVFILRPKRGKAVIEVPSRGPTVADLLRPLLTRAATDKLSVEEKAQLNRILFRFWQVKLGLIGTDPASSLIELREHEQAGELLKCLDRWLYSPETVKGDELKGILEPYGGAFAADLHLEDLK